jgi:ATP-dependent DNA ligase
MLKAFEFCLPTAAKAVPADPDWIHEVKYDGYSLRVERQGKSVRLITRNGHDWTKRFPWIVQAAPKNREQQFVIEVRLWLLGVDGVSDFTRCIRASTTTRCSSKCAGCELRTML